jgi:hypothetical protein
MFQVVKRLGCAEKLTKSLEARLKGLSAMQVSVSSINILGAYQECQNTCNGKRILYCIYSILSMASVLTH